MMKLACPDWHRLASRIDTLPLPKSLRVIIVGRGSLEPALLKKWYTHVSTECRLIHTEGPLETTIAATWKDISTSLSSVNGKHEVGHTFSGVHLSVLNHFLQPALPGTIGDLYIGGIQTADGYLNQESLTAQNFVYLKHSRSKLCYFKTGQPVNLDLSGRLFFNENNDTVSITGNEQHPGFIPEKVLNETAEKSIPPRSFWWAIR